jgi:asparagine synthase (glutamine-hydrolysing)
MSNKDGTVWLTFNGEIYNFLELRQELESAGHRFITRSDTEVIIQAYEKYGLDCIKKFRGMFALALWDERAKTLLLARDRIGKKPLFYAEVDGQLVFASELQGLLRHPGLFREMDFTALDDYLTYGYVPAPKTIFRNVFKLPPAHYLTLQVKAPGQTQARVQRYWRLEYRSKVHLGEDEAVEGFLEVLKEAVSLRLIADVPLGALLSGGIDSSLVVALMSELSDQRVKTFSIGFDDREFDELRYARLVAARYGTEHHEFVVRPDAGEILPTLIRHYGEPYADSSAIPTYYVAKMTRDRVKVALNGDGGDECLAGYERYLGMRMADRYARLPGFVRRLAIEPLGRLIPESIPRRSRLRQVKRLLEIATDQAPRRYLRWVRYLSPEAKAALYTPGLRKQLGGYGAERWLLEMWDEASRKGLDLVDTALAVDVESYLPGDLLAKMDTASMANSLEVRSPFLDHKVMEFCAKLPGAYKLRGMTLKYLLKRAGRSVLPQEILRRRKMGFGLPAGDWMRRAWRPWVEDILLSPQAAKREYFEPGALRHLVHAHLNGHHDHSFVLWGLLCLELWHREFLH